MVKNVNYQFIKEKDAKVELSKENHAIYFVNSSMATLRDDKALFVASKVLEKSEVENCALRINIKLNDSNNLYEELKEQDNTMYTLVYFNSTVEKLFVISGDALEIMIAFLEVCIGKKQYKSSSEFLQMVICSADEEQGIEVIDISSFNE